MAVRQRATKANCVLRHKKRFPMEAEQGGCLFLSFELGETRELRRAAGGEGQLCFAFRRKKFPGPNKADALIFVSSTRSGASVNSLAE